MSAFEATRLETAVLHDYIEDLKTKIPDSSEYIAALKASSPVNISYNRDSIDNIDEMGKQMKSIYDEASNMVLHKDKILKAQEEHIIRLEQEIEALNLKFTEQSSELNTIKEESKALKQAAKSELKASSKEASISTHCSKILGLCKEGEEENICHS